MAKSTDGRQITISARGNLNVYGWDQPEIHVRDDEHSTQVLERDGGTHVEANGNCDVQVPRNAQLLVLKCRGNLIVKGVQHVAARGVRGNVEMLTVQHVTLSAVGGNLQAKDSVLLSFDGNVSIGGNAEFRLEQGITVSAGGHMHVDARGLGSCLIESRSGHGNRRIQIGSGETRISLNSGGRQKIGLPDSAHENKSAPIGNDWGSQIGELLTGLGDHVGSELGEAIQAKITNRLSRAGERMARAAARAEHGQQRSTHWSFGWGNPAAPPPTASPQPAREPISDKERLTILRMVQEKSITSEQADALLAALEY